MLDRIVAVFWFVIGFGFLVFATMLRDPLIYSLRPGVLTFMGLPLVVMLWFIWRKRWVLTIIFAAGCLTAVAKELRFSARKEYVIHAESERRWRYGQHMIVGFRDPEMIEELVKIQGIGGIFLSAQNVNDLSAEQVKAWIDGLQAIQKANGLPKLIVACDQEGGVVSRMTPPLPPGPALSTFVKDRSGAEVWGYRQAAQLVSLGINMNFSPVVDVPSSSDFSKLDRFSQIPTRAISSNPDTVSQIATAYSKGLARGQVIPVAKHFPGLGSVKTDTHLFTARLGIPIKEWRESDGLPFRALRKSDTETAVMMSHVIFETVDPDNPASVSSAAVRFAREETGWNTQLVTDDINMRPTFHRKGGVGKSAKDALDAGVDWILISYMGETYFPIMSYLLKTERL